MEEGQQRGRVGERNDEEENEGGGGSGLGFYPTLRETGSGWTDEVDAGCAPGSNGSR
jgi:hypothetical protein